MIVKQIILLIITLILFLLNVVFLSSISTLKTLVIILYYIAFLTGSFYKLKEGVNKSLKEKHLNVEVLMILASIGSFILKDYKEGILLLMIFSLSGILETYALNKSSQSLTQLLSIVPNEACLLKDNREIRVPAASLKTLDTVIVRAGEVIPVDGIIHLGSAAINQQAITGESLPVFKTKTESVYAGTINMDGFLTIVANKDAKDSMVAKMVSMVKNAKESKTKSQTWLEAFEKYYVYIVLLLSLIMMIIPSVFSWLTFEEAFYRGIVILVVGSPCAVVASITPAMLSGLSIAAKNKILIKNTKTFETLVQIKVISFDKTGTITTGQLAIKSMIYAPNIQQSTLNSIIFTLESKSNHPLAKAIIRDLKGEILPISNIVEFAGKGIEAHYQKNTYQIGRFDYNDDYLLLDQIKSDEHYSLVHVIKDGLLIAVILLEDTLRPLIKDTISELKKQAYLPILMTGDHELSARSVCMSLEMFAYHSMCFPKDKVNHIKYYQNNYGKVLMIGDGINDAPALATADLGASLHSGMDVTLETADVIFVEDNIDMLPYLFRLSKKIRKIIMQNLFFSLAIIVILLIANIFGLVLLPLGVVMHEGSTILVILNSLRILFSKAN